MPYERDSAAYTEEVHYYFPEWADRPASMGLLLESVHNSYLAGGYSEEFGYQVRSDHATAHPPLRGNPEDDRLWRVQIGGLHPGYPECPHPHDRDRAASGGGGLARAGEGEGAASLDLRGNHRVDGDTHEPVSRIKVVQAREGRHEPSRRTRLPTRVASAWTRVGAFGARLHSAIGGMPVIHR